MVYYSMDWKLFVNLPLVGSLHLALKQSLQISFHGDMERTYSGSIYWNCRWHHSSIRTLHKSTWVHTIYDKLQFNEHVSVCWSKVTKQLNPISMISRHINLKSNSIVFNSFIASDLNYGLLVWHFWGAANNNRLEKLRDQSFRICTIISKLRFRAW